MENNLPLFGGLLCASLMGKRSLQLLFASCESRDKLSERRHASQGAVNVIATSSGGAWLFAHTGVVFGQLGFVTPGSQQLWNQRESPKVRVCVCVCVSNPGQRVFHHHSFHFTQAGGSRVCSWREPTKLQVQTRISKEDALSTYLPPQLLTKLSNLLGLFPWFFMIPSPKPVPPQH